MAATPDRITRLSQISEGLDAVIELAYWDDDVPVKNVADGAIRTAGAATIAGGALYLRGRSALKKDYLPGMAPKGVAGIGENIAAGAKAFKKDASGIFGGLAKRLAPVAKALSSRHERLIELNSKMDEVVELDDRNKSEARGALKVAGAAGLGVAGYQAYKNRNAISIGANLLRQPGAREAISHDVRTGLAKKATGLARWLRP